MKQRFWELDALRGFTILLMIAVHLLYDLIYIFRVLDNGPSAFHFLSEWGGIIFLVLSGVCVTLGSRPIKRGLIVFACGLIINVVTYFMYYLGYAQRDIVIYFGVLHLLGSAMMLWPLLKKCPSYVLFAIGVLIIAGGFYLLNNVRAQSYLLIPFGIQPRKFLTSDYFPLLPYLGFFLLGSVLGRIVYRKKKSLLPAWNEKSYLLRFACLCGRNSLWIYMLHQPVLYLILLLIL